MDGTLGPHAALSDAFLMNGNRADIFFLVVCTKKKANSLLIQLFETQGQTKKEGKRRVWGMIS